MGMLLVLSLRYRGFSGLQEQGEEGNAKYAVSGDWVIFGHAIAE
jgi:hypothetical protein